MNTNATGEKSSKRTRTTDSENMTPILTQPTAGQQTTMTSYATPLQRGAAAAMDANVNPKPTAVSFTFESLPEALQSVANHYGKQFLKTITSKTQKEKSIKNLESDDVIPQAAAFESKNFLKAISEVRDSDEFRTLSADVTSILSSTTSLIKGKMKEAGLLEIHHYQESMNNCFFNSVHAFAELLLIDRDYTDPDPPIRTLALLCLETHTEALVLYQAFDAVDVFTLFNKHIEGEDLVHIRGTLSAADKANHSADCLTLFYLLKEIFINRWNAARDIVATREKNNALQLAQKARLKTKATAETSKAMDLEGTMDQSTVDQLIKERISKETSSLKSELGRLKQQVARAQGTDIHDESIVSKNNHRGATAQRASAIKTNQQSTPKQSNKPSKRQTNRPGNDSAAAAANATSNVSTKQKKGKKKGKPKKPPTSKKVAFDKSTHK
jgi:hypothetical protein